MNNLFILHTQYHLILATSLIISKHAKDNNFLILFEDFKISEKMMDSIESIFTHVEVYPGTSGSKPTWRSKASKYVKLNDKFKRDERVYDNVYLVEDTVIPEQLLMKYSYRKNCNVHFYYVGDGGDAYFHNNYERKTGFSKSGALMLIRKIVFKYFFRLGKFYSGNSLFGASDLIESCYELYPAYLREELKSKKGEEIDSASLRTAINRLYSHLSVSEFRKPAVILLLDKMTVYADIELFEQTLNMIIEHAKLENRTIYYKYHPIERNKCDKLANCIEIERNIPAEFIFANADPNETLIVGFLTTALQSAKRMGFDVTSYIQSFDPKRTEVIDLYKKIGINVK